ncbi:MAG: thiamine biosynthesis protein ThiF [Elusimicrobia bacterium GWA2_61_42]|nr:MAG: thiamine biosynthesis protein ThiF [Elusimicrobia bacterium GWA2_61_42]OGR75706.1 MAG: thiamine biosynthesis protein ThiF [Elusimicrobia bacterium GWC2_61_25]
MTKLEKDIFSRHDKKVLAALRAATVGIAGAGGLGSNAAIALARAGVARLIIADFDKIEPSNLNRQQYTVKQVGLRKVKALQANLKLIAPFTRCEARDIKIKPSNIAAVFGAADILIEAFDKADQKGMLINAWLQLYPDRPLIAASGLAGYGRNSKLRTRKMGNLYICGDGDSQCAAGVSPMAPRVALVANMQANLAVELLIRIKGKKNV